MDEVEFESVLAGLLAMTAPHGFVSYLQGEPEEAMCWFSSARNAAAWLVTMDPERAGTEYEYFVRPARYKPIGV